jgi:hypothetical protein
MYDNHFGYKQKFLKEKRSQWNWILSDKYVQDTMISKRANKWKQILLIGQSQRLAHVVAFKWSLTLYDMLIGGVEKIISTLSLM